MVSAPPHSIRYKRGGVAVSGIWDCSFWWQPRVSIEASAGEFGPMRYEFDTVRFLYTPILLMNGEKGTFEVSGPADGESPLPIARIQPFGLVFEPAGRTTT